MIEKIISNENTRMKYKLGKLSINDNKATKFYKNLK